MVNFDNSFNTFNEMTAKIKISFYFKTGQNSFKNFSGSTSEFKTLYDSITADHIHYLYRKDCVRNDASVGITFYLSEIFMNLLKTYGVITDFHTDFSQREITQEFHTIPIFQKTYDSHSRTYTFNAKFQKQGNFSVVYTIITNIQDKNTFIAQFNQIANQIETQFKELFENELKTNYVYYKAKFSGWLEPATLFLKLGGRNFIADEFDFRYLEILEWQSEPGGGGGGGNGGGNGGGGNGSQPPSQPFPEPEKKFPWIILIILLILIFLRR